ncbi:hypothetical protein D621_05630 [beta proteobacterium AAP51]|nr:hypothetical protein D621_05630 [beta proteobacterium AAP51]
MTTEEYEAVCQVVASLLSAEREKTKALEARVKILEARAPAVTKPMIEQFASEIGKATKAGIEMRTNPLGERMDKVEAQVRALNAKVDPA